MDKKIYKIIGMIELGLLPFLPNYLINFTQQRMEQKPPVLESIVENVERGAADKKTILSKYGMPTINKDYSEGPYKKILNGYLQKHIREKEDMSSRVPLKWLNILPETMMGGVLGFTYIGDHSMGRRADLAGSTARMVDIHESIHTPDEYETRVLTSWIMEKVKGRYVK